MHLIAIFGSPSYNLTKVIECKAYFWVTWTVLVLNGIEGRRQSHPRTIQDSSNRKIWSLSHDPLKVIECSMPFFADLDHLAPNKLEGQGQMPPCIILSENCPRCI